MSSRAVLIVAALALLFGTPGCPKRETVGFGAMSILGEGVINDPKNRSLRFDLLKFGLDEFCRELSLRGAPLKLRDGEPVLGRFFADRCQSQVIDEEHRKSLVVQFSGKGYAWTNVTGRIGFTTAGVLEYAPDFRLHEGAMYVYFRPRNIDSASFTMTLVESNLAQTAISVTGISPDQVGRNIVESQLNRGFTVIRYGAGGETELGLGYIPTGERPFHPFTVVRSDKLSLDNDRTEVHTGQQDFIGGFRVAESGQALYLTITVDGAPGVDVFIVPKVDGDRLIDGYVRNPGGVLLNAPPLLDEAVVAGERFQRAVNLPAGLYYLMIDHTAKLGRTVPPAVAGDDRAAKVDYLVQLGDQP